MSGAYRVRDLSFSYESEPVLRIEHLDIEAGSVVALVGPNGSGKTTLLHILAFLEKPDAGSVSFFERDASVESVVSLRRRVGLLLQQPYLFHTSVMANVMQGLRLQGEGRSESRRRARKALELVGMSKLEDRQARSLSGGESQLVALARAIVLDPPVLLLDEPSNHVDKMGVERTRDTVLRLNREQGKTIIFTTHDLVRQAYNPDRVVSLFEGRLVASAGDNLFAGRLGQDGTIFDTGRIEVALGRRFETGSHISIDPAYISVHALRPREVRRNVFEGRIVAMSEVAGRVKLTIRAGEAFMVVVSQEAWQRMNVELGQRVWIVPEEAGVHVLA